MTNAEIIFRERCRLMMEGKLAGTGRVLTFQDEEGKEIQVEEPQEIHTYAAWKGLGYQVKKGEKALAKFTIWKYTTSRKAQETEEEAQERGHCFMKLSFFFAPAQVEKA